MYFDYQNLLSNDQTLIGSSTDVTYSDNVYDLYNGGSAVKKIGTGEIVKVYAQMTTTLVGATSTVDIELVCGSSATVGATNLALIQARLAVPVATLVAGYGLLFVIPLDQIAQRYLRMRYTINTANTTAGAITAGIISDIQTAFSDWPAETGR